MGSILFGSKQGVVSKVVAWGIVILALLKVADIAEYFDQNGLASVIYGILLIPVVIAIIAGLFNVIIKGRGAKKIEAEHEADEVEEEEEEVLEVHGDFMQTYYIKLNDDPIKILRYIKGMIGEPYEVWKTINSRFSRSPFKGDREYNAIRLFTLSMMQETKPLPEHSK